MTSEPKEKFSDFWKAAQVDGWFTKMNLSEKLTYILAYKHYSLESGCDANLEFYRLIKEEAIPSLQQTIPKQESDALLKSAVQDAEGVLESALISFTKINNLLPIDKETGKRYVSVVPSKCLTFCVNTASKEIEKINLWKSGKNR